MLDAGKGWLAAFISASGGDMPQEEVRIGGPTGAPGARSAGRAILPVLRSIWRRGATPYLILALAPLLPHLPAALLGLSADPIWTMSWIVSGQSPGPFPGLPFGDPNVGWTNQALGHLAAHDWLTGRVPWWNPYSGIGLPLAGEMQPSALFLPFILLLILPHGLFWLEYAMQMLAGVATYALLRRLDCSRFASLTGGLLYALSGTFAIVPNEAVLNVIPFLPVLLLGIENARSVATAHRGVILVGLGIGFSLLGGFPEPAFIDGLFGLLWTLCRLIETEARLRFILRVMLGGIAGLAIASPQIVALFDFVRQSDVFANHGMGFVSMLPQGLAPIVFPNIYGPISNPYTGRILTSVFGAEGGFLGLPLIFVGILGFLQPKRRVLKLALLVWLVLCAGKLFGFMSIMSVVNVIPFMKQTEFIRYAAASWELPTIILAAMAIDQIRERARFVRLSAVLAMLLALVAITVALPWAAFWHRHGAGLAYMQAWFVGAVMLGLLGFAPILLALSSGLRAMAKASITGGVLIGEASLLLAVPLLSGMHPGSVDQRAIVFLRRHLGLQRFYTVGPLAPNYSAYYGISSVDENYLPVARNWGRYVGDHLFHQAAIYRGAVFWAPFPPLLPSQALEDLRTNLKYFERLGVRYLVTKPGATLAAQRVVPSSTAQGVAVGLKPGQSVTIDGLVPKTVASLGKVTNVGIYQASYYGKATGVLVYRLCSEGVCEAGRRNLKEAADNALFYITLRHAMKLKPGSAFTLDISHVSGSHKDGLWLYPDRPGAAIVKTSFGPAGHRAVRIGFADANSTDGIVPVYRDRVVTIWRLPHPQPYFSVIGGPCRLGEATRHAVNAACSAPAKLVRRELYMPGWTATEGGVSVPVRRHADILQSIALPKGRTRVVFSFVPPHMRLAALAFVLGWLGLVSLMVVEWLAWRRRQH